ncbi:hypothetical protein CTAYLR_003247 [Chrysophaeum taylorii]|uniref:Ion transport domain-containing protein n=1 Tax=Chrysophaeum taylorii TaxID=2483200 RepID=A0AAD7UBD2_9STRA|nr:hypothetical protein CTAYLR_003247 [Chrysophaeum taylorii]
MASSGAYLCESMPSLMRYGENSEHCREVVRDYCSIRASRRDPVRDPGCFTVLNVSDAGVYTIDPSKRIKFNLRGPDCDNRDDCFRSGYNFGNIGRNPRALTCKRPLSNDDFRRKPTATALPFVESSSSRSAAATRRGLVQFRGDDRRPFRVQSELPSLRWFTGVRYMLNPNAIYDICWRPECNSGHEMDYDFEDDWLYMETGIAVLSASEIVMRLIAIHPDPHYKATADAYFWTDVASLVPYFAEIGVPLFDRGAKIDFTLGPKERWWMFLFKSLKLFRFFKIARHMDGWSVVVETILKIRQKLLIPLFFLFLINLIAAMLVYNFEFEKVCRYGVDCGTLADGVPSYPNGTRIATNIYDQVASLSSALDGFWLSLVTMTSVGFGRITPTTAAGRCVMVFAMIFGQFYLAMPLTIVGSQFYKLWLKRHTTLTEAIRIAGSQDRSQTLRKPIVLSKGLRDDVAALKGLTLAFSKSLDNLESVAFSRSRSDVSVLQLPSGGEPVPTVEEQDLAQVAANLATLLLFHPRLSRLVRNVVNQLRKVEHMKRRTAHSFEVPEVVGDGASALRDSFCSTVPEY